MTEGYERGDHIEVTLAYTTYESCMTKNLLDGRVRHPAGSPSCKSHSRLVHNEEQASEVVEAECHDLKRSAYGDFHVSAPDVPCQSLRQMISGKRRLSPVFDE